MKTSNLKVRAIESREQADEVEKALLAREGVRRATVHPGDPAGVEVQYEDGHLSAELLVASLRKKGYDAEIGGHSAGGAP